MNKWQATVISQYNQSPTMQTLLYAMNQWIRPDDNLDDFYKLIWNVDSAQGYGLDVWGRIVAVNRVLQIQATTPYFGFEEATNLSAWPWNQGIFYSGEKLTQNHVLDDIGFRTLIMAKAAFNICNGSIPAMNAILLALFPGRGNAYVVDNQDMSMTYVFDFVPSNVEAAIIGQSGVLPKPAGVSVGYIFNPVPIGPQAPFAYANINGTGNLGATPSGVKWSMGGASSGVGNVSANPSVRAPTVPASVNGSGFIAVDATVAAAARQAGALVQGSALIAGTGVVTVARWDFFKWDDGSTWV